MHPDLAFLQILRLDQALQGARGASQAVGLGFLCLTLSGLKTD